ncbi:CHAT domain-containing protein [Micromonospora carbonacea]|uniref:CHAT domain-containing protein n=1 Tax=Micromonospora carbonacea TaxID=47853 RepID=A0A1C4YE01_9ACTN|nr:CHAT domain-containing protein [Micromonospora carbonacea]SCF18957.1 CHAT domain-containing protein [Micromonospora carbonacea]
MTDATEESQLPQDVLRLEAVLMNVDSESEAVLRDDVTTGLASVVKTMPGQPWELAARYVAGHLRLMRATLGVGADADRTDVPNPELLAGVELLRPLSDEYPETLHPLVRGVHRGTHVVAGNGIVELIEMWNGRLADLIADGFDETDAWAAAWLAYRQVEDLSTNDHRDRAQHLVNMCSFQWRLSRTGQDSQAALDQAVELARRAVAAPASVDTHAVALLLLAGCLADGIDEASSAADFTEAIAAHRAALNALSDGDPYEKTLRVQLAGLLGDLGNRVKSEELVAEALEILRGLGASAGEADGHLALIYAVGLSFYSQLTGRREDLIEAVDILRRLTADLESAGRPAASIYHNLANTVSDLNQQVGDARLGAEATEAARRAVDLEPTPRHRSNLGMRLREQYEQAPRTELLVEAIVELRAAYDQGVDDPYRPRYLGRLGLALALRAERTGDGQALREAIAGLTRANEETPIDDSFRVTHLVNLGLAYSTAASWWWPGARAQAIEAYRAALAMLPPNHIKRGRYLANLASMLLLGDDAERTEGIERLREAIAVTHEDQPDRSHAEGTLASALRSQYRSGHDPAVLDEALELARSAAGRLFQANVKVRLLLADLQLDQAASGEATNLREALDLCRVTAQDPDAAPATAIEAASRWGRGAADHHLWAEATTALALAVRQFPLLTARELRRSDRAAALARHSHSVAADAAACALNSGDPELALELIEAGRGVLIGQAAELRDDLEQLATYAPDLVNAFERLRTDIEALEGAHDEGPGVSTGPAEFRAWRDRWAALIAEVRSRPHLERFQLPSTCDELLSLAGDGPIAVVNLSRYRCDALLLTGGGLVTVPLPGLSLDAVQQRLPDFVGTVDDIGKTAPLKQMRARERIVEEMLEWLWEAVAEPVLHALGLTGPPGEGQPWPRMWWMPTGLLAFFPLHAAGRPGDGGAAVLDRVVSSYASTLAGLRRARHHVCGTMSGDGAVIAVPATPGHAPLPGAAAEAAAISERFPKASLFIGPDATTGAVLSALREYEWAHFACHGYADVVEAARSRLQLYDGPLLLSDLWNLRLGAKSFAFLASCDSAQGGFASIDESQQLAAMFQASGYRHVIGSLWRIVDALAAQIAGDVYERLAGASVGCRFDAVPFALHEATRRLRASYRRTPGLWAAHVHFGP